MRVALATTVLTAAVSATAPAVAGTAPSPTPKQIQRAVSRAERAKSLWATVNICDTTKYPNTLGVRGQMPALGFPAWLSMHIQVDYYSSTEKKFVPDPQSRKVIRLGRSSTGLQQGGALYAFNPPTPLLQATVVFMWRRLGHLLGETTLTTTAGHRAADFGSPPHYSAAQCRIRKP